jgi:C_GCAxxG_C_C family probable redox protein
MLEKHTAGELAGNKFREGFNCAESVLRAFRDELKLDISDDALKIATAFGGGLGHAGCLCGALSGAVMVLSLLDGRNSATESREPAYGSAREFHEAFSRTFGGTCCRALNRFELGSREQRKQCLKITSDTANLLMEMLERRGLSIAASQETAQ